MKISEASALTGLDAQNIRFYEKQGLLSPDRLVMNRYRDYSENDVRCLKEIKLLRKLGISLSDIQLLQKGVISLPAALRHREEELRESLDRLDFLKSICSELGKSGAPLNALDTDIYLKKIDTMETRGISFTEIARDYLQKIKDALPRYRAFWFEPKEPILTARNFTNELIRYCEEEHKDLIILKESLSPLAQIDGETYLFMLEQPRTIDLPFPFSAFFFLTNTYGFRFAYAYRYEE